VDNRLDVESNRLNDLSAQLVMPPRAQTDAEATSRRTHGAGQQLGSIARRGVNSPLIQKHAGRPRHGRSEARRSGPAAWARTTRSTRALKAEVAQAALAP
jgi:hypothetical protein